MAQIDHINGYTRVRWDKDDWYAGLLPTHGSTGTGSRIGNGFNDTTAIDPFRSPGYLSPGYLPADATNVSIVDAVLKNGVSDGNKAYIMSAGTKLHELTISTNTLTTPTTFPHTITAHGGHSTVVGEDVAIYYLDGTKYLFYSWNDNTDGDIGRYDMSATFYDDYMSTAATGGAVLDKDYPHPMIVGDDNILYIGDGPNLASLQGTTAAGIFNASALDLPTGYVITSFAKTSDYLVIYAYKNTSVSGSSYLRSEATAFFWDYVSVSYTYAYPLLGNYVNGGFNVGGVPGCFVRGQAADSVSSKQSKMLLFENGSFQTKVAFNDNIPGRGGVEVTGESIIWNSDGKIYVYGNPYIGYPRGLHKTSALGGTTSEGMLKNFFNSSLLGSAGTTTSGGLESLGSNFVLQATAYTGLVQLPSLGRDRYRVNFVKVNFLATINDTGRAFRIALNTDNRSGFDNEEQRGLFSYLYNSSSDSPTIDQISKIYDTNIDGNPLPDVSTSIGMLIQWGDELPESSGSAPQIESIEVYLEPTTNNQQA